MKTLFLFPILVLLAAAMAFPQGANDLDTLVTVPKRYVSAEGLAHQAPAEFNQWIGIGKEIGIATKEGLDAVVDTTNKFGATRVGTFVMVMIAWKIIGGDALRIGLGIPFLIIGLGVWFHLYKRLFIGYRVLATVEGPWYSRKKTYADHPAYKFASGDARTMSGVFLSIFMIVLVVVACIVVLS